MQGRSVGKEVSSILPLFAAAISWYLEGPNHRQVLLMRPVWSCSLFVLQDPDRASHQIARHTHKRTQPRDQM